MAENRTRVDFNAPASLVERADVVADILDMSRTQFLVRALRDELATLATDEEFRRELEEAYYGDRVDFETVQAALGTEEALRLKLLRESLTREPPEPRLDREPPSGEEFYDGDVPEWTPDRDATGEGDRSRTE